GGWGRPGSWRLEAGGLRKYGDIRAKRIRQLRIEGERRVREVRPALDQVAGGCEHQAIDERRFPLLIVGNWQRQVEVDRLLMRVHSRCVLEIEDAVAELAPHELETVHLV